MVYSVKGVVEIYTFTKEECGIDFDAEVYLRINKDLFVNVSEEDKYDFGKELDLMFDTLAELTDAACERKGDSGTVYKFPLYLSSESDAEHKYDPISKLFEMCEKVGEGYAVYVGYKRYTFRGNIYYCPQLRLANVCDERGGLTMYNIMSFKMEKGKPRIEQMRNMKKKGDKNEAEEVFLQRS